MNTECIRVLCVDDNCDIADTEAMMLNLYGFDARACYDGFEALELAREFRPHAYLVDLDMPGMDGCEVARVLRGEVRRSTAVARRGHRQRQSGRPAPHRRSGLR